ncbi:MAG: hypothetical protein HC769_35200 [Cyanobacteria bacterium CRU_2_1]|nr:hypothetical protein [Cyanobacteria bacterium CRU_2_1]
MSNAVIRIPGQSDVCVPIATIRLMQEFEPLVQIFFADTSLPPVVLKAAAQKVKRRGDGGLCVLVMNVK